MPEESGKGSFMTERDENTKEHLPGRLVYYLTILF
jgi:hypothetical protein